MLHIQSLKASEVQLSAFFLLYHLRPYILRYLFFPSSFHLSIYCIFVTMNDNPIIIESDLEGSVSSSLRKGIKSELHSFSSIDGGFKLEIIHLVDDSKMEGTSGESLSEGAPYMDSLETLFSAKLGRGESLVEKPMPPHVLTEEEIEASYKMREHIDSFIKTYRGVIGLEPSDAEIAHHLECRGQSDDVSWISPNDHYKADVLDHKGF